MGVAVVENRSNVNLSPLFPCGNKWEHQADYALAYVTSNLDDSCFAEAMVVRWPWFDLPLGLRTEPFLSTGLYTG